MHRPGHLHVASRAHVLYTALAEAREGLPYMDYARIEIYVDAFQPEVLVGPQTRTERDGNDPALPTGARGLDNASHFVGRERIDAVLFAIDFDWLHARHRIVGDEILPVVSPFTARP